MKLERYRDLAFICINDEVLVIACDSCGGVGNKERDLVKVSPEVVGYYTTHVALAEILAIGAQPLMVVNTLSVEMDDTGKAILNGINEALMPLGLDVLVTGSTEENFPMCQTGIGVTIIGAIDKETWVRPTSRPGDVVVSLGLSKVGHEVILDGGRETLTIEHLLRLKELSYIHEIIPVGSKGILHEFMEMARLNHLEYVLDKDLCVDIRRTAGPATCAIASLTEGDLSRLVEDSPLPVNRVGSLWI